MVLPSQKSAASKKRFCITCSRNQSDSFNTVVALSVEMRTVCSDLEEMSKGSSYGQRRMVAVEILIVP